MSFEHGGYRQDFDKKLAERRKRARRQDLFAKCFLTVCTVLVMCIPATLFVLLKGTLQPDGFWQNLAVWMGGIAIFGGLQVWLIVAGVGILFTVIWKD